VNAVNTAESKYKGENLCWKKGETALSMAQKFQLEEIIRLLIEVEAE